MDPYGYEGEIAPNEDEVIDEVLGENPRARELRQMRTALEQRRAAFQRDREHATDLQDLARLSARITEMDKQIEVLRQEEAITTFVEDSVRVTLHKPSPEDLI